MSKKYMSLAKNLGGRVGVEEKFKEGRDPNFFENFTLDL
jgi:hypothetical protein